MPRRTDHIVCGISTENWVDSGVVEKPPINPLTWTQDMKLRAPERILRWKLSHNGTFAVFHAGRNLCKENIARLKQRQAR